MIIIGLGIILYVIITGGFWAFAYISAIGGDQFSSSFYLFLWFLISPLLPIVGIVYLIDFIFCMLCYGKTRCKHKEKLHELYEEKNKIVAVNKYAGLYEIDISGKKHKLNIVNYKNKNYACDDPDLLIKHLRDDTIKKYKSIYFLLTNEELNGSN